VDKQVKLAESVTALRKLAIQCYTQYAILLLSLLNHLLVAQ